MQNELLEDSNITDKIPNGTWSHENDYHFYKKNPGDAIWMVKTAKRKVGPIYFTFDKKNIFNFWTDYPDKLTKDQIELFKAEKPGLAKLKQA